MSEHAQPAKSGGPSACPSPYVSLTLSSIPPERHPAERTACQQCHAALWHATSGELRCFCRAMRLMSWTSAEPEVLTICDGLTFGAEI